MAAKLVSEQAVFEAAAALAAEGVEPSPATVRQRIGVGSFTTIKKFLDGWKTKHAQPIAVAPETPPEIAAKGNDLARAVWVMASAHAEKIARAAREQAAADVAAMRTALNDALAEIARLEIIEGEHTELQAQHTASQRAAEVAMAEASAHAKRADELNAALARAQEDLRALRQTAAQETQRCADKLVKAEAAAQAAREEAAELRGQLKTTKR